MRKSIRLCFVITSNLATLKKYEKFELYKLYVVKTFET